MVRVLVVEDDENLRLAVSTELAANGLLVDVAADLAGAGRALAAAEHHCVVFDRMLPDGDAADHVRERRRSGWATPVLFLTARDRLTDRVAGFEVGGDDYLVKPFAVAELTARVLVLCRRAGSGRPSVLRYDSLEMDCATRRVSRDDARLALSDKEFAVLEFLLIRPEVTASRAELIEHCWDSSTDPMSNVVDVVVRRLRRKLGVPELVHTVRGHGYRLVAR